MRHVRGRGVRRFGAVFLGLAAGTLSGSAIAAEPWVYGEPRAGFMCVYPRGSDCRMHGTLGAAAGVGYSGALAILHFGVQGEASIANLFHGDDSGLSATLAAIGFGGFELGVVDIDMGVGVGAGALALPRRSVSDLYWTARLRVAGRLDWRDSYVTIGGVVGGQFFSLGDYTATGVTFGLEIGYSWRRHEGGWYFMN